MTFLAKIKQQALGLALGQVLSSEHAPEQYEAVMNALATEDDEQVETLEIVVWQPYEHDDLSDVWTSINEHALNFEDSMLQAVDLYKQSVEPENAAKIILTLKEGLDGDIWYDADKFADKEVGGMIETTKSAIQEAIDLIYAFSVATAKDVVVGPWDSTQYGGAYPIEPKHIMSLDDQRRSNGQLYVDFKDVLTGFGVMAVTHEIDTESRPTAHLHFDDNQVAASFRKTADREITIELETNIGLEYVSAGVYKFTAEE